MNRGVLTAVVFGAAAMIGGPESASAQATRTWVSGVGDDANPCSRTAPCKTFAGAISKTATAGEINVLDPGGFGGVTITKSITIRSDHVEAGVLVAGTNGITVAAGPTDNVTLEGLDIDGAAGTGLHGVSITSGLRVHIIHCAIRHFLQNGVNMQSNTPGAQVFIKDSTIYFNGGSSGSGFGGVFVQGSGAGNVASVLNSVVDNNANFAVQASGAGNVVAVANSILSDSPTDLSLVGGAAGISFGPSNVMPDSSSAFTTLPLK